MLFDDIDPSMPYYYTITQTNTSLQSQPIILQKNITGSCNIVPSGQLSDYDITVIRTVIDNTDTPLMDMNGVDWKIIFQYDDGSQTYIQIEDVMYDPSITGRTDGLIMQFDQFIQILNQTLISAYNNLAGQVPLPTTKKPFFDYDPINQLITFYGDSGYLTNLPLPYYIQVLFNFDLSQILTGFNLRPIQSSPNYFQLIMINTGTNYDPVADIYHTTQVGMAFDQIIPISQIVIQTNLQIPMEMLQENTHLPIVLDFYPPLTIGNYRNDLYYEPIVPYRQYPIQGNPQTINFSIYRMNPQGFMSPMTLASNQSATVKLMFTEKSRNKFA